MLPGEFQHYERGTAEMFDWLKARLRWRLVEDVPVELAECEFGCRIKRCEHGEWLSCENRIRRMNREIDFAETRRTHDRAAVQGKPDEAS